MPSSSTAEIARRRAGSKARSRRAPPAANASMFNSSSVPNTITERRPCPTQRGRTGLARAPASRTAAQPTSRHPARTRSPRCRRGTSADGAQRCSWRRSAHAHMHTEARALGRGHHREPARLDVSQARPGAEHLTELGASPVERQPCHITASKRFRIARALCAGARSVPRLGPRSRVSPGGDLCRNAEASARSCTPRARRTERVETRARRGNIAEVRKPTTVRALSRAMGSARGVLATIRSRHRFNTTIRLGGEVGEASSSARRARRSATRGCTGARLGRNLGVALLNERERLRSAR